MAEQTESKTASQAKEKAYIAVMDAITDGIADIRANDYSISSQSARVKDLAYAYRLIAGGAQPGSVEVSSK